MISGMGEEGSAANVLRKVAEVVGFDAQVPGVALSTKGAHF